jgi:hypothetical protein
MLQTLVLIYEDIIKFHQITLKQFLRRRQYTFPELLLHYKTNGRCVEWEKLFKETWDTCKSRLLEIISGLARRRSLIENQAEQLHIQEPQESPPTLVVLSTTETQLSHEAEQRQLDRRRVVNSWLRATTPDNDQYRFSKIRKEYPSTGQWILDNQSFKEWFDTRFAIIPPLLWLKGSPGTGEFLASKREKRK